MFNDRFERRGNDWYAPPIDPHEEKDYQLTLTKLLGVDTIASVTWEATSGITIVTGKNTNTTTTATVWLSDGTAGQVYTITAKIITAQGRQFDRSFKLVCREL